MLSVYQGLCWLFAWSITFNLHNCIVMVAGRHIVMIKWRDKPGIQGTQIPAKASNKHVYANTANASLQETEGSWLRTFCLCKALFHWTPSNCQLSIFTTRSRRHLKVTVSKTNIEDCSSPRLPSSVNTNCIFLLFKWNTVQPSLTPLLLSYASSSLSADPVISTLNMYPGSHAAFSSPLLWPTETPCSSPGLLH